MRKLTFPRQGEKFEIEVLHVQLKYLVRECRKGVKRIEAPLFEQKI